MFHPQARSGVVLCFSDHHIHVGRTGALDGNPLGLDELQEFSIHDGTGLGDWLHGRFPDRGPKGHVSGWCAFHPTSRVLTRDNLVLRRLAEPDYLRGLVAQHAGIASAAEWTVAALHPADGTPLTPEGAPRPGLIFGVPWSSIREAQARLLELGVRPRRLEVDTLALLGGVMRLLAHNSYPHAAVVCEIEHAVTRVFILGKDGVHTPQAFPHGFLSMAEAAMKLLNVPDLVSAQHALEQPSEQIAGHSRRIVRMISRHLRPAVDYYELQTGQRVGALYCAQLPAKLGWLGEALAGAVDLEPIAVDFPAWLPTVGLQLGADAPALGPAWLPFFSLAANLAPAAHDAKS